MKPVIDHFSTQSAAYAEFRPVYPTALFDFIFEKTEGRRLAWDAGTGSGQVARVLAQRFEKVVATDISENQLAHAAQLENIEYRLERAEKTSLADRSVDLVTVGQAIHWFDFEAFFAEIRRSARPGATVAVFGYGNQKFDDARLQPVFLDFYEREMDGFWSPERRWIDEGYATVPFPFDEVAAAPDFFIEKNFSRAEFGGYIGSWSSVQRFIRARGFDPVPAFLERLEWPEGERRRSVFPVFLRLGRV